MKSSTVIAKLYSSVDTVWNVVTNNNNFDWRSDLSKIVVSDDGNKFSEFAKKWL